jgi:hypothetical protein
MEEINKEEIKPKKKISKKVLSFAIIGVLALILVSAAVVTYLSNSARVNITVGQPMKVWLNNDENSVELNIPESGVLTAGDPILFTINEKNLGSNPLQVYNVLIEVTSDKEFDGTEFANLYLTDGQINHIDVLSSLKFIRADGSYGAFTSIAGEHTKSAKLMFATDGTTLSKFDFGAGVTHTSALDVRLNSGIAPGVYTIKVCDVNTLVGATCA